MRRIKVFFDTNVVLDLLIPGRECDFARAILSAVKAHRLEGQISTQSILDARYSSQKQGVPMEQFKLFYDDLRSYINIDSIDSLNLQWAFDNYKGDLEDDAQYACAYDGGCDYFLTRDKRMYERNNPLCPMTVISPEEFVAAMKEK